MSVRPSVAHVMWGGDIGGIERSVQNLAFEQRRRGLDPFVVVGEGEGTRVRSMRREGIRVVTLNLRSPRDLNPIRLRRAIRSWPASDVIHLHNLNPVLAVLLSSLRRAPLVYTERIPLHLTSPTARRMRSWFLRSRADAGVTVSEYSTSLLRKVVRPSGPEIITVHNGSRFAPLLPSSAAGSHPTAPLRIAYAGRLSDWKRVDRLIGAVARVRPRESIEVVIAGDGPMRGELENQVRAAGLQRQVTFCGYLDELDQLYASVDVLVLPSEGEPFGLVVLEACAQGALPIVFTNSGGSIEALPPDGIVVEDEARLAECLEGLRGSPLLSGSSRAARAAWVRSNFSIETTAARYIGIYESVSGRKMARASA